MGTLTVRENLEFSANLRLSRIEFSAEDKKLKVNAVIRELSLQDCADTKVTERAGSTPACHTVYE